MIFDAKIVRIAYLAHGQINTLFCFFLQALRRREAALVLSCIQICKKESKIFGHLFAEKPLEKRRLRSLRHFGAPPRFILYTNMKKIKIFGHLFAEKTLEKRRLGSLRHFGAPPSF